METFLTAHGQDPGPYQRPLLAGAITGLLATIPATAVLAAFGSLRVEAEILGLPLAATLAAGAAAMVVAGVLYGRLFQRAANDRRGGWLFGMAFGFLLWMAGAVMVLPLLSGGAAPGGTAAVGVFLSLIAWGLTLGILFPYIHKPLQADISGDPRAGGDRFGPEAVVSTWRLLRLRV